MGSRVCTHPKNMKAANENNSPAMQAALEAVRNMVCSCARKPQESRKRFRVGQDRFFLEAFQWSNLTPWRGF